jgi:hypothetical protein
MYIFLSHSARDKIFVRRIADSLSFYGIPIFFDEREIKVGDNIPEKIYDGLERATHVIYVLSKNSIQSEWVKEELSVAKMKQMDKKGCHILPVLIDDVSPPSSISHIKYADFKNWKLKESYIQSLKELLIPLDVKAHYSSSVELLFFQKHLNYVTKLMAFASSASQTYFQLERLWFCLFKRDSFDARSWLYDTVTKTWDVEGLKQICHVFENEVAVLDSNAEKIQKVLDLCKLIENDYFFLISNTESDDAYYEKIWKAENSANELSAILYSIILELQGVMVSQ